MNELDLTVEYRDGSTEPLTLPIANIANCGLAVEQERAQAHLDEMEEEGIVVTQEPPIVFQIPSHAVTTADRLEVNDPKTSGEVEYVLFPTDEEVYIGVASDHTDRSMETVEEDIPKSKTICPNVVSETVWPLSEVRAHWGQLQLESWTGSENESEQYQDTRIDVFYTPEKLIETVEERSAVPTEGMAILSGTVDAVGDLEYGDFFAAKMYDPVLDRSLSLDYEVGVVDWLQPR